MGLQAGNKRMRLGGSHAWMQAEPLRVATLVAEPSGRLVRPRASATPGVRRAGSGAWAGLCNTQFWVDRTSGVCGSIYSNFLPFVTPEAFGMYNDFERALYTSL